MTSLRLLRLDESVLQWIQETNKGRKMIRFKTKADNKGKDGNEAFHVVSEASLDLIQDHWLKTQTILGVSIRRSYKTLRGAENSLKQGEVMVMEKPMGI
jgi:hypothetical protein